MTDNDQFYHNKDTSHYNTSVDKRNPASNNDCMDQQVAIRLREASDVEARIEFAYEPENSVATMLIGTISGPRLDGSRTLPATVPLRPMTKDAAAAAEAILPDPCYWSPEMPFLYDVSLELIRADEVVDSATFPVALHPKRAVKQ